MAEFKTNDEPEFTHQLVSWLEKPLINTEWTKAYRGYDLINRPELLFHPIEVMTTLVQLGYEPLPPKFNKNIFGRTQLQFPGFFTYTKFIISRDGIFGIYRGLKYNLAYNVTYRFVYKNVNHLQKQTSVFAPLSSKEEMYANPKNLALTLASGIISNFTALAVAYPIHVMMIRSISQFIGQETHYDSVAGAILDIYITGGLSGFYAGFTAYFLSQYAFFCIETLGQYILRNYTDKSLELWENNYLLSAINIVSRPLIYPFRMVSTVMACNGSSAVSLVASAYTGPEYDNWVQCWRALYRHGEIKRGSSLFWRYKPVNSSLMYPLQPSNKPFKIDINSLQ